MQFDKLRLPNIMEGLKSLGRMRLVALGVVGVLLLLSLGVIAFHNRSEPMALLYGDLELNEAAEMVDDLAKAHIPTTTGPDGRSLYVPGNDVAQARLLLAKAGLPGGGAVGYELFDKSGTLTSTQFEQGIDETRALEGELERSIRLIHGVRNVRVHLVLPHRDLFSTETNPSQASVILDVGRSGAVSEDAIAAIQNLVSAAVPGLRTHGISIVDTRGDVLARPGDPDSLAGQESSLEKQRHSEEQRLAQAVEDILTPTLGLGHVRARAAVTMNTDIIHETDESYDPNQQVLRSQSTSTDKSANSEANQNTSVGNNLPNANAGQNNRTGSSEERTDETNNYEIGKRTRVINQTRPRVSRISLAVMVDGTVTTDQAGKPSWKPLDEAEVKRLTQLVQTAIGYDKTRGDEVNVVSMPFRVDGGADMPHQDTPFFTREMIIYLAEWIVPILLLLGAAAMLLGPILRRARKGAGAEGAVAGAEAAADGSSAEGGEAGRSDRISVDGVEGEMRREALARVTQRVEENPDDAIAVVRNWLAEPEPPKQTAEG
ncbi:MULTISPECIES: flagellar basal-body MS-ring/collar protein FliF [Acetobacteraceae]|uniref:Flagellar M-ring protein n=2 Tax=Acetobacteraceae TaxID=433 RepID=A0A7U7J002_9PROT|nr:MULTISPECIES: flagellar basal-body MS-ring/collar protein FliF [Acetobacteraceae]MCQ0040924.1 flagellar M-ring protein FliF [Bombella sp.]MCT6819406.1 flagellar M-ring protein FliF [Bombella apis]CDG33035.1 Flagellar M-ring protein FliF [Parasaccharibacter apium]